MALRGGGGRFRRVVENFGVESFRSWLTEADISYR